MCSKLKINPEYGKILFETNRNALVDEIGLKPSLKGKFEEAKFLFWLRKPGYTLLLFSKYGQQDLPVFIVINFFHRLILQISPNIPAFKFLQYLPFSPLFGPKLTSHVGSGKSFFIKKTFFNQLTHDFLKGITPRSDVHQFIPHLLVGPLLIDTVLAHLLQHDLRIDGISADH